MQIVYQPIGLIHTPYTSKEEVPRQGRFNKEIMGKIILDKSFEPGLKDLEGFSHLILLFHFHKAEEHKLVFTPRKDTKLRGVFSTRAPIRPNPIGMSIVELISIDKNILTIANLDMLDGTPLLDIKPYIPDLEVKGNIRIGWLEGRFNKRD